MFQRRFIGRAIAIGMCVAAVTLCATSAHAGKRAICTPAFVDYQKALESAKAGRLSEARELLQTCLQATVCGGLLPKCTAKYNELAGAETTATTATAAARTAPPSAAQATAPPASATSTGIERTRDRADMSSVVPVVTDESGEPRVDVQVRMDGTLLVSHLDGKGVHVEPGVHEFTFSADGGVFSTQKIMIVEGQRNRPISASLHSQDLGARKTAVAASAPPGPQAAPDKPASDRPVPAASEMPASDASSPREVAKETAPAEASPADRPRNGGRSPFIYVLGGVGLAGIGTGVVLTALGIKDNSALSQCSPACPQAKLDNIRTLYFASDIAAGVGVAALGVATWLFVHSGSSAETSPPPNQQAFLHLDVHPTPSGAFASVSRAF